MSAGLLIREYCYIKGARGFLNVRESLCKRIMMLLKTRALLLSTEQWDADRKE